MNSLEHVHTVTVVGLGKTGVGLCKLLHSLGKKVKLTEQKSRERSAKDHEKVKSHIVDAEFGSHTLDFIKDSQLIVVNPSVPLHSVIFTWAREHNIPVIGEIELCFLLCKGTIVAVTGSIGKTTTTALTFKILKKHSGRRTHLLGNIGIPFSEYVLQVGADDIVCLEVSSYQLSTIERFRPHIAVLLNIVPNHLDVHASFQEYRACKLNIFKNQTAQNYAVVSEHLRPQLPELAQSKAQKVFFSANGFRNENFSAAVAVASLFGIDARLAGEVIQQFKGLPHRLEYVKTINGIAYVNDSKSTTVESTIWALQQIKGPVFLICGGRDKGLSYDRLLPHLRAVREVLVIGEAQDKICNALASGPVAQRRCATLADAVQTARTTAQFGDTVLLSCMCSSFDMFKDYKERGNVFKKLIHSLRA